jgi:hypothetical protein
MITAITTITVLTAAGVFGYSKRREAKFDCEQKLRQEDVDMRNKKRFFFTKAY